MNQNALFNVIAQPALWILEELKNGVGSIARLETLQAEAHAQLSHLIKTGTTAGYPERSLKIIHYALCVALDQAGKQTQGKAGALKGLWMQRSLLASFYKEQLEHNSLISMIKTLTDSPEQYQDEITVLQHLGRLGLVLPATVFSVRSLEKYEPQLISLHEIRSTNPSSPPIQILQIPNAPAKPWVALVAIIVGVSTLAILITLLLIDRQERRALESNIAQLNSQLQHAQNTLEGFQAILNPDVASGMLETSIRGEQFFLTLSNELAFKVGSAELSEAAQMTLQRLANLILQSDHRIKVIGHSDDSTGTGVSTYNQALSENRAKNVASYLISLGVPQTRIQAIGKGTTEPIGDNTTVLGRQLNRRVDIVLYH